MYTYGDSGAEPVNGLLSIKEKGKQLPQNSAGGWDSCRKSCGGASPVLGKGRYSKIVLFSYFPLLFLKFPTIAFSLPKSHFV